MGRTKLIAVAALAAVALLGAAALMGAVALPSGGGRLLAAGPTPDTLATRQAESEVQTVRKEGESVFVGATPQLLAAGAVPAYPPLPADIALQRVRIAPGGHVDTPGDDPRLVLLYVERGTLTVRNTVAAVVTRADGSRTAMPAGMTFTMGAGDAYVSPVRSGGELRNAGTAEVSLLAALLVPDLPGTPPATPAP